MPPGKVLRTFTGTPKAAADAGGRPAGRWRLRRRRRRASASQKGMNRFTWDLRQEGAVVFPGMIMWAAQPQRGPASPPGKYGVRITANGETKTRDFAIGIDPRLVADGITESVAAGAVQALRAKSATG